MKRIKQTGLHQVGGKAYHLLKMQAAGLPVPDFAVFAFDFFQNSTSSADLERMEAAYRSGELDLSQLSQQLQDWAKEQFAREDLTAAESWIHQEFSQKDCRFAVRSSATIEDGKTSSFAGQFESQLNVKPEGLKEAIQATLLSLYQESALSYLFEQGLSLKQAQMICLVQVMQEGDLSGIYFTANPKGILNEHIIVIGRGLGNKVVEDKIPTTMVTLHPKDQLFYTEQTEDSPDVSQEQLEELQALASQVSQLFGPYMDMEFTFANGKLYLLQARPITTLPEGQRIILDNSNIVESYPGVSSPLTISFIQEAYASIFRSLAQRLVGKGAPELAAYEATFQNMLQPVNSRVYYQIQSWYQLLQLLPFSKKIIPIWQDMLGVRETEVPQMPVHLSAFKRLQIMLRIIREFWTAPKQMRQLEDQFAQIQREYEASFSPDADAETLISLVSKLKEDILAHWDITLVNDLYAFVYTGLLKKSRRGGAVQAEIAGIEQIESMRPALALQALTAQLKTEENAEIRQAMASESPAFFLSHQHPLVQEIVHFIHEFGDRAPEELKLETPTFRTHPERLLKLLLQMCQQEEKKLASQKLEEEVQKSDWWTNFLRKRAMTGVKYRESSRLNRTRIYGMMRQIFRTLGQQLVEQGLLATPDDVFYLTKEELFELTRKPRDVSDLITERREKLEADKELPTFSRYVFAGQAFEKYLKPQNRTSSHNTGNPALQGIGCSPGFVKAQVLVVEDVQEIESAQDRIIVTKMTDPGWVYLLTQSKGVIAEQGSLLSHTAIISRELGIPSIVNVRGACSHLQNGDWIEMDGLAGKIRLIKEEDHAGN